MKKVLIITYYWPPAGGPGVQRWLKFVKYLPDFGIEPIVYIPENPHYPIEDENLLAEVPSGVRIISNPIWEPYRLGAIFGKGKVKKMSSGIIPSERKQTLFEQAALWIRGNFFIPDARVFWVNPSVRYLSNYLEENKIDTIITTGPPHSLHLIGLRLRNRMNVRWIADFRDPWTTIGYHKKLMLTPIAARRHDKLERKVLDSADVIIVTSPTTKADFQLKTHRPVHLITNGFDIKINPDAPKSEKFRISHIGSLLSGRNPASLWQALSELGKENQDFARVFQLVLAGAVGDEIVDSIRKYDLEDHLSLEGYVSHDKAVALQRESNVLLLIEIDSDETKCILPGKLFEYMAASRPILAIGPKGSDIAGFLSETKTGNFFGYSEKDEIKAEIWRLFVEFQSGVSKPTANSIDKYSRKNLTSELASILSQPWGS